MCSTDLLAIAGQELAMVLLPKLQGAERHSGLMLASAIRMVMREIGGSGNLPEVPGKAKTGQSIRGGMSDGSRDIFQALLAETVKNVSYTKPAMLNETEMALLA
jgi:hypothetical protein